MSGVTFCDMCFSSELNYELEYKICVGCYNIYHKTCTDLLNDNETISDCFCKQNLKTIATELAIDVMIERKIQMDIAWETLGLINDSDYDDYSYSEYTTDQSTSISETN